MKIRYPFQQTVEHLVHTCQVRGQARWEAEIADSQLQQYLDQYNNFDQWEFAGNGPITHQDTYDMAVEATETFDAAIEKLRIVREENPLFPFIYRLHIPAIG